jgi:peptidyl-prolyl cis-trans isomerase SurA
MRFFILVTALFIGVSMSAHAQRSDSIAAVVNGDVITYTDLSDRMDLVIRSAGMPNNRDFRKRLLPQVLTGLITEKVQIQEAERLDITTSAEEIEEGFAKIAQDNKMSADQFRSVIKRQKVKMRTLEHQILAQLSWGKVVQSQIRPRVVLGDSDIESEMARLESKQGQTEYSMAEIFLPFDSEGNKTDTQKAARDLVKQLSKDVQKFPAAARQFSQNASAANGGIIGWITADQMAPEISLVVQNLETRTVSDPIPVDDGYMILFIRDKRVIDLNRGQDTTTDNKLRIKTATFKLSDNQGAREAMKQAANDFARDVKGCLDIVKRAASNKGITLDDVNDTPANLSAEIVSAVENATIGQAVDPIVKENEVIVPMLCGRSGGATVNASTALEMEVEQRMGLQRMDILQKRYLRDLISDAYIERRV